MKNGGLTPDAVETKLREFNGNMAAVGRHFGVTRQAVWDFCNRRKSLKGVSSDIREGMKDNAESSLYNAVLKGEAWAVCFYLKTQAKDRGYVEKFQMEGGDPDKPIRTDGTVTHDLSDHLKTHLDALAAERGESGADVPAAES